MSTSYPLRKIAGTMPQFAPANYKALTVQALTNGQEDEVLAFLSARPLHTVFMAGMIRDNGLESPFNRGTFYAYRNEAGKLEGVALVGHATLIEARSEAALQAFAKEAQN